MSITTGGKTKRNPVIRTFWLWLWAGCLSLGLLSIIAGGVEVGSGCGYGCGGGGGSAIEPPAGSLFTDPMEMPVDHSAPGLAQVGVEARIEND